MLAFIDQIEYNFLRFQRITEMHEVLMRTPPPFNVLFVLWDLLVFGCRGLCNLRRKKGFEMRPHTRSLHDTAEGQQHRLVDLYMDAEDAAQNASVDGLLNACRELLLEERANATSRFLKLVGLNGEMNHMLSKVCAALPQIVPKSSGVKQETIITAPALAPAASQADTYLEPAPSIAGQPAPFTHDDGIVQPHASDTLVQSELLESKVIDKVVARPPALQVHQREEALENPLDVTIGPLSTGGTSRSPAPAPTLRGPRSARKKKSEFNSIVQL